MPQFRDSQTSPLGLLAPVVLSGFALFTLLCEPGGWSTLDKFGGALVAGHSHGHLARVAGTVYQLGTPEGAVCLALGIAAVLLSHHRARGALLVLIALGVAVLFEAWIRGLLLGTLLLHPDAAQSFGNYPSGHTLRVVLLIGAASLSLPRRFQLSGFVVALLCGCMVGIQRIATGAHTPSDVAGGLMLGAGFAATCAVLLPYIEGNVGKGFRVGRLRFESPA